LAATYVVATEVRVMVDDSSNATLSSPPPSNDGRSPWRFLLPIVWAGLGIRLAVAFARNESVREDFLSLALVAFLMTTAVLGSRVWLWIHDHSGHLMRRPHATGAQAGG
jgi:hypothetical protein